MRRAARVAAFLLASACFDDVLVGPEPNIKTSFDISIRVRHDEEATYFVFGNFTPGSDSEGNARTMLDSSMRVADSAIQGVRTTDRVPLTYTWNDSTTSMVRDTLAVRGPVLKGQASPTTTVLVPLPARADAGFLEHAVGEDVRLNVSTYGEAPYGFGSDAELWLLEIQDARQNLSLLRLQGIHPKSPIVIPWQLVPAVAGDSLVAILQVNSIFASVLTAYPTFVQVFGYLKWRLRIVAAPPP